MTLCESITARLESAPGRANAVTGERLAVDILGGARAIRLVQRAIRHLRATGVPICGADGGVMGYYIPATIEEADAFFHSTKQRAQATFGTIGNVAKALNKRFVTNKYLAPTLFDSLVESNYHSD